MKLSLLPGGAALALLLVGCGNSSPDSSTGASTGASAATGAGGAASTGTGGAASTGTGGSGGTGGTGPSCEDPTALPDMACGTLTWATSPVKARPRNHHVTILAETQAGPFLYALGGWGGKSTLVNVDRTAINTDGSLNPWTPEAPMLLGLGGFTGELVSQVIVIAGGMANNVTRDKSYSAVVSSDGALGAWKEAGSIGHARMHPASFMKGDTMYVLGGFDDPTVWDDVVRATVQPDGTVSAWTPAGTLPGPRSHASVTLVDGYVFVAGGLAKSALANPPFLNDVIRGHLAADGTVGEWTPMPHLPVALATHASFFYGGYLYAGGGIATSKQEKRIWRAPIGADHVLGAWEASASLPIARGHVHQLPVYHDHVYSVAGAIDFNLTPTDEVDIGSFL